MREGGGRQEGIDGFGEVVGLELRVVGASGRGAGEEEVEGKEMGGGVCLFFRALLSFLDYSFALHHLV